MQELLFVEQPATRWEDAFPTGNGHLGAMVYGAIHEETILVNHERLWLPLFEPPRLPTMAGHLPKYRRLMEQGKFAAAEKFWSRQLKKEGWPDLIYTNPFHPAFDLRITQPIDVPFSSYKRSLNLATGETSAGWKAEGVTYQRRTFVSRADDLIITHITSSHSARINLKIKLEAHPFLEDPRKAWHYPKHYTESELPLQYESRAHEEFLSIDGRYTRGGGFLGMARVVNRGGKAVADENSISITSANEVYVLVGIDPSKRDKNAHRALAAALRKVPLQYPKLLNRHAKLHGELYGRVRFDLGDRGETLSNETLLADAYRSEAPSELIVRLFNYSRYLFISSTAPGGLPPNLQGAWNGDYIPAWSSDYTLDENVQMAHWQVLPANLPELMEPYFRLFEASLEDWKANARSFYGCRGVMAPLRQSDNGLMSENMPYLIWTAGAGWIARMFYDYFLYTGDKVFLKERAIPFLKEVALFYEDFLYEGSDGKLIVCPSMSPENVPDVPNATLGSINPTMDVAVCREVLSSLIDACTLLKQDPEEVPKWEAMLQKLPSYEINEDGALGEWLYPGLKDNYHHRHLSHIYGLFPGIEITREQTPELFAACNVAVEKRLCVGLKSQTGWSIAHMANIYARLSKGNKALECFDLLSRSCLGPNFLTYHNDWRRQGLSDYFGGYPPFQIDANLGIGAAVIEMLVFSVPGVVKTLPALPDRWPKGKIKGIRCRGRVIIDLKWDTQVGIITVHLRSEIRQEINVAFPAWISKVQIGRKPLPRLRKEGDLFWVVVRVDKTSGVTLKAKRQ